MAARKKSIDDEERRHRVTQTAAKAESILPKVYLAGPGVFRCDATAFSEQLKNLCRAHGLEPLWPLDNAISNDSDKLRQANNIRIANEGMIREAEAVVAEISPFRGPNMDPGTAYEIGFARALCKPVFLWSTDPRPLLQRTLDGQTVNRGDILYDANMLAIENFGLSENLMIATPDGIVFQTPAEAFTACARRMASRS